MTGVRHFHDEEIEYYFERRRYGSGPSTRFYVWMNYRVGQSTEWHSYGDPWPKVTPSRAELQQALHEIRTKHKQ